MSKGYWKLEVLNNFISGTLYQNINKDDMNCQILVNQKQEYSVFSFLLDFQVRASILSFVSDFSNTVDRKTLMQHILPSSCWQIFKTSFDKYQFTPTVLYWYLQKVKCSTNLAKRLSNAMKLGFVSISDYKQTTSINKRQDILLTSILVE